MKHNGEPCGETSEAKACNVQACEKDCELREWTKWSSCTKDCDGGTMKRQKFVKHNALGEGKCADPWAPSRLQYKPCNEQACVKNMTETLKCKGKIDVVLVLDGSGSLGQTGWKQTKKFSRLFVEAFDGKSMDAQIAVLLYSGPRTWSGVSRCMGESPDKSKLDLEKDCSMRWVQHFNNNTAKTLANLKKAKWPRGGTLTSLALGTVANELTLGRKDAKTAVVVVTDGRPLSFKRTLEAAKSLRTQARLLFVPVTAFAPMKEIKSWASRRWQENVVKVNNFNDLSKVDTVDHLIADLCPNIDDNRGDKQCIQLLQGHHPLCKQCDESNHREAHHSVLAELLLNRTCCLLREEVLTLGFRLCRSSFSNPLVPWTAWASPIDGSTFSEWHRKIYHLHLGCQPRTRS